MSTGSGTITPIPDILLYDVGGALTRKQLREEIAMVFGFHQDTVTSGTSTTVVDSGLTMYGDDYWNGSWLMLFTATGEGPNLDVRRVIDYAGATGLLSVYPPFTGLAAAQNGDTYQLYQNVSPDEINRAIMRSSHGAEIATSITPSTTEVDYQLANAVSLKRRQQITGVWLRSGNRVNIMPQRITNYEIEDAEGLLTLRIPQLLSSDDHFWITYLLDDGSMLSDTDHVNLPAELIRARAVVYLIEILLSRQDMSGTDRWGTLMRMWSDIKTEEERKFQQVHRRVTTFDWTSHNPRDPMERLGIKSLYT